MAHRLAWLWHYGEWPTQVDHINRVKSDNRIENLRLATNSQNRANTGLRRDNASGQTGVWFDNHRKKWAAEIHWQNQKTRLGRFNTFEAAQSAYRQAAKEKFGEFALP
jgi:hypothetical protein